MVERILKLLGETNLSSDDDNDRKPAAAVKPTVVTVPERQASFLEELAREECRGFPCNEHSRAASLNNINVPTAGNDHTHNMDDDDGQADENEDHILKGRREFHLLQWGSDDDSYHSFDSDDYMTDEEIGIDNNERGAIDSDEDSFGSEDELENEPNRQLNDEALGWEDRTSMPALHPQVELSRLHTNPITSLLVGLANSENEPLIRAAIDWNYITQCPNLPAYYPAPELDDPYGARLLQGTLRMDPTLEAIEKILDDFPKSCLDMSGFFAACQFANPKTSRKPKQGGRKKLHPLLLKSQNKRTRLNPYETEEKEEDDAGYDSDDSDVGEVVKLVMSRTINARKSSNIEWGMVAFLGDARTTAAHTKELLLHNPEALIDTKHGAFGVSPLDRMVSGNFIHGDTTAWAEKLRLALRAASFVRLTKERMEQEEAEGNPPASKEISLPDGFFAPYSQFLRTVNSYLSLSDMNQETAPANNPQDLSLQSFYPYHELVRLLISPSFGGAKFGDTGFLKSLDACTNSDPNAFLRPDNQGNLPIHVALSSECDTALGVKGERRLIRYLLNLDKDVALCPENNGKGRLPLRMCIDNGWPVYDLIVNAALSCEDTSGLKTPYDKDDVTYRFKDHIAQIMICDKPLLHDALGGGYHPRFGIHGARQLVKNILVKTSHTQQSQSCLQSRLRSFFDSQGRTALHVALEHKWPVYDIIVQENPLSLELRDPTHHGFFPFQIAACSFLQKSENVDDDKDTVSRNCNFGADNQELLETSMLFELIRENPLCVSWNDSDGKTHIASPTPNEKKASVTFDESERERHISSTALLTSNEESTQSDRKRRLSSRS
jgi:hypothetical protein